MNAPEAPVNDRIGIPAFSLALGLFLVAAGFSILAGVGSAAALEQKIRYGLSILAFLGAGGAVGGIFFRLQANQRVLLAEIARLKSLDEKKAGNHGMLRRVLDTLPQRVLWKDRNSAFLGCNRAFLNDAGLERLEDLIGKTDDDMQGGKNSSRYRADDQAVMESGLPKFGIEEPLIKFNGEQMWIKTSKHPLRDPHGRIEGVLVTYEDITGHKRTENELLLLRSLLNHSLDYIYFKDSQSRFIRASTAQALLFGAKSPEELVGKTDFDFFTEDYARATWEDEQRIMRTGLPLIAKAEKECWKDGREDSWVLTTKMPLLDEYGAIIGTFGISKDFTAIKKAESQLEEMHKQLRETSHRAGMAEVATSVLHNVGNVLNSVNVSCSVIFDKVRKSRVASVPKAAELLQAHEGKLDAFLAEDTIGRTLPGYLQRLGQRLADEQAVILQEIQALRKNVGHIKEIIAMQQSYSNVGGTREMLSMNDLVEDAIRMNSESLAGAEVKVEREFGDSPLISIEKHKVLQILVNLIRNAKDSLAESTRHDKRLILRIRHNPGCVQISIADNGVGIAAENKPRVFSYGFTTKKQGHGFGLHSSALAAREMGGRLDVSSDGPGKGATFVLELPSNSG
jgi:PAS domain S-box-containing protein